MNILLLLPSWLGDTVMTTPAVENLVDFHKNSRITLIGSSVAIEVFKNHPNVVKAYPIDSKITTLYQALKSLGRFDLFISFRGSLRASIIQFFVSSKKKFKFNKNTYFDGHQVQKYNDFLNDSLKIQTIPGGLVLNFEKENNVKKNKLLGINPGASYGSAKQWYPEEFAKVASNLADQFDIVIFGGPKEISICSDIENYLIKKGVTNYLNLANKTSIEELIRKISMLDLLITGDSGPMHLAAVFQISTIAIFGPTKDKETSQWQNDNSVIVKKNLDCQPCMKRTCPLNHHNCMKLIEASDVLHEAKAILFKN